MSSRRVIEADELAGLIGDGAVDTVLVVFPDLQGRLVGKRVTGPFWLDHASSPEGIEVCNYLLAVDVDMSPLPGYRFANWDQGYGDVRAVPDLSTIRLVPWIDRTALVLCDLADVDTGDPVEVAPRRVLQRQVERARAAGYTPMFGAEIEFFLFRESYEEAAAQGYGSLTPHSDYIEDYHILQTTKEEWLIRQMRAGLEGAGVPVEFSKGEAGRGQHEINLRFADALEMADRAVIYKNACKEIAALNGRSLTFMAKYDHAEAGSSCHVHSSLWDDDGRHSLMWDDDTHSSSKLFGSYLGGLLASARELSLLFAPFVNSYKRYQADSWAPTAIAWGHDNRTTGLRCVGHGDGHRVECRIPGADANPYLAFAATIAAGLAGVDAGLDAGPPFEGNAYAATDLPRVPTSLTEAIALFDESDLARSAFGDDVHHHLLNTARQELAAFERVVTDWERRRNFERI
jgi:glutamine synthetase